jgi:hypothetical protein
MSALGTAIAFMRHGHAVLPLCWPVEVNGRRACSCKKAADCPSAAKHPLGRLAPRGLLDASTDEAIARKWFADEPQANLGVRTDQLIVLDADPRHGGDETLAALEQANSFPPTWRVITGGLGQHILFKCPHGVTVNSSNADTNAVLGAGLDIRARNGFVVAPPSKHMSGRAYAWSVDHHPKYTPLAEAPAWLVARLARPAPGNGHARPPVPPDVWAALTSEVTEYADGAAARIAGHLLRRGVDAGLALGLLRGWNATCCKPPLDLAELYRVFDRIAGKEAHRLEQLNDR